MELVSQPFTDSFAEKSYGLLQRQVKLAKMSMNPVLEGHSIPMIIDCLWLEFLLYFWEVAVQGIPYRSMFAYLRADKSTVPRNR